MVALGVNAKETSCVSTGPVLEGQNRSHKKKEKTPPTIVEISKSNIGNLESSAERESSN